MTIALVLLLLAAIAIAAVIWRVRQFTRQRARAARRARWGRPDERARNLEVIAGLHAMRAAQGAGALDARTWGDLDLDLVFAHLDRTSSHLGSQLLYHRLRSSPTAAHLQSFESMVERFGRDQEARDRAQAVLEQLRDPAVLDVWQLTQPGALPDERWRRVLPIIAVSVALLMLLAFVWPILITAVVICTVVNLVIRAWTAPRIGAVLAAFRQLAAVISAAEALRPLTDPAWGPLTAALHDDLAGLERLRAVARWAGRDTIPSDPITQAIFGYLNLLFLVDANALHIGAQRLRTHAAALMRVIEAVGEIDAAIAVASFRAGAGVWRQPEFTDPGTRTELIDARHPLVRDAVPNSVALGPPHGLLVTGANMAGKSTFIRTVGLATVMAQTLHTCLASGYRSPVRIVRSALRVDDDVTTGRSYYLVEVETLVALVKAAGSGAPHLFLVDELFRGTNAVERIAAAEAVLRGLAEARNGGPPPHVTLAATHDGELAGLLHGVYETVHFADSLSPEGLAFDYRVRPGPTSTRNAIALLRLEGAPDSVVEQALARAAALDRARAESPDRPR